MKNYTMSSSTLIALARVVANEEIDCIHRPSIMTANERLDALYDIRTMLELMSAPNFRIKQINQIIEECEYCWREELDYDYQEAIVYELEKNQELQRMGN